MRQDDPLAIYVHEHATRAVQILERLDSAPVADLGRAASIESVHDLRTSLRRLRATQRTFARSFTASEPAPSPSSDRDLRFVARTLSELRDTDVLAEEMSAQIGELPTGRARDRALDLITAALAERRRTGLAHVARRRGTRRWLRAVAQLEAWQQTPPRLDEREPLLPLLEAARTEVHDRLARADGDLDALHSARKAAKRWRYAAEVLQEVEPGAASHFEAATAVHERLGQMQDAVVAAAFLDALTHVSALEDGTARAIGTVREHVRLQIDEIVAQAPHLL